MARRKTGPRSYIGKILLVAFLGTHIPLLTLLAHFIISNSLSTSATTRALAVALVATLAGTGLTLFALTQLLKPILATRQGLRHYLSENAVPNLPTDFSDEAGGLMADTQQALEKLDDIIVHLAHYDALTLLPNKTLFEERVALAYRALSDEAEFMNAVLVVDVDGLKNVNDLYGHQTGDRFIKEVAARLGQAVRDGDTLARIGGDEFALLQTRVKAVDDLIALAQRLCEAADQEPIILDGQSVRASVSIGIALANAVSQDTSPDLLRDAEAAMYQAKQQGTGQFGFYSPEANAQMRKLLACDNALRGALQKNEFVLHYQPQIDLETGATVGVEALLRWNRAGSGLVAPGEFIPLAEKNGLIIPIGQWALHTACAQNKAWQNAGFAPVRVAVNLSARQFHHPNLVGCVAQILEETGLAPQRLELEITESLALGSETETIAVLQKLRDMGIALSLDDFGTGYSSLSQLKRFPLDTLKIDRSFLHDVSQGSDNAAIVSGIIGLAHNLKLSVVAEGVETGEQVAFLKENGCEVSQGFLHSRPVPAEGITALFAQSAVAPAR